MIATIPSNGTQKPTTPQMSAATASPVPPESCGATGMGAVGGAGLNWLIGRILRPWKATDRRTAAAAPAWR